MSDSAGAGTNICMKCKGTKESTRMRSNLCRACDGAGAKRGRMRVTIDLPGDVYARLEAEASAEDVTPATLLRRLVLSRDKRRVSGNRG